MSWSVPCVAIVVKTEPRSAAQIVYSLPRMPLIAPKVGWPFITFSSPECVVGARPEPLSKILRSPG